MLKECAALQKEVILEHSCVFKNNLIFMNDVTLAVIFYFANVFNSLLHES